MSKILFYDTECNGLDVTGGFIQELAWATYDVESKRLISCHSHILNHGRHYEVEESAFRATGLSKDFCEKTGYPAQPALLSLVNDMQDADFICGHNILQYDNNMLDSNLKRQCWRGLEAVSDLDKKLFIDTMYDVPYPSGQRILALKYLALDHGYVLTGAHQAMADVFACAHILFSYNIHQILEVAKTPMVKLATYTDYWDQAARERAYAAKFRWEREKKRWEKQCRAYFIPQIQETLKLDMFIIQGECEEFKEYKQLSLGDVSQPESVNEHPEIPF